MVEPYVFPTIQRMDRQMNIILLRGAVPQDRDPKEICRESIEAEDDIYSHIAYAMAGKDNGRVLYFGGKRKVSYSETFSIEWVKKLDSYVPDFEPDLILARGGFPEYNGFLKNYKNSKTCKIWYYGAGKRFVPKGNIKYDLVLADDERQQKKLTDSGFKARCWFKPAPPQFKPVDVEKKYDLCFVAIHPSDPRKRVKWVYETMPKGLTMLQLGYKPDFKVPEGVHIRRIPRSRMPEAMSQCRVGLVPYDEGNSAPRCISEFMACDVPVIAFKDFALWDMVYRIRREKKKLFWNAVKTYLKYDELRFRTYKRYVENLNMEKCVEHLKGLL